MSKPIPEHALGLTDWHSPTESVWSGDHTRHYPRQERQEWFVELIAWIEGRLDERVDGCVEPKQVFGHSIERIQGLYSLDLQEEAEEAVYVDSAGLWTPAASSVDDESLCAPPTAEPEFAPRPPNAFILYRMQHYKRVQYEHPSMSTQDVSRHLGEQWRHESPHVRQYFVAMSKKVRHEHERLYKGVPKRHKRPRRY